MSGEATFQLYRRLREMTEARRPQRAPGDVIYALVQCLCDEMLAYNLDFDDVVAMLQHQMQSSREILRHGGYEQHQRTLDKVMN